MVSAPFHTGRCNLFQFSLYWLILLVLVTGYTTAHIPHLAACTLPNVPFFCHSESLHCCSYSLVLLLFQNSKSNSTSMFIPNRNVYIVTKRCLWACSWSTICNQQKLEAMQRPINARTGKLWKTHTMEYYMAMRITDPQLRATIWRNLTHTMLNRRSQKEKKTTYCVIPFIWSSKTCKASLWFEKSRERLPLSSYFCGLQGGGCWLLVMFCFLQLDASYMEICSNLFSAVQLGFVQFYAYMLCFSK